MTGETATSIWNASRRARCYHCNGTGFLTHPDPKLLGTKLRGLRKAQGVSARAVATLVKCTPSHISDLEAGKRNWTKEKFEAYLLALEKLE